MKLSNPNWPEDAANAPGTTDTRNVIDHFKYWKEDAIRAELDTRRTELVVVCENLAHDFNIGTVIRNANAFVANRIFMVGRKKYDKRGAVGTYNYEHVEHVADPAVLYARLKEEGYRIVVMDNIPGSHDIGDYQWETKTAIIMGQENIGTSPMALAAADDVIYIPQLGSTRSLNVGVASGIAMFDYMTKTKQFS